MKRAEGLSERVEELEAELDDAMRQCESAQERLKNDSELDSGEAASASSHSVTEDLQREVDRLQTLLAAAEASKSEMQLRVELCD